MLVDCKCADNVYYEKSVQANLDVLFKQHVLTQLETLWPCKIFGCFLDDFAVKTQPLQTPPFLHSIMVDFSQQSYLYIYSKGCQSIISPHHWLL